MGSVMGKGGGDAPPAPNLAALVPQQVALNKDSFNTSLTAGRVNQNGPMASTGWTKDPKTGQWTQNTSLTGPAAAMSDAAMRGATSAVSSYNPANNPKFDPAATEAGIYKGEMSLLEPKMQSDMTNLKDQLGAQGFDMTGAGPGGATSSINNLENQQNLTRTNVAGNAQALAIPQAAQAVSAESQAQLSPLQAGGMLTNTAIQPLTTAGTGQAQTPGLATPDLLGATQQTYANNVSNYNAQQANSSNSMNGLFSLAGNAAMYAALA